MYAELRDQVSKAGILDRDYSYYTLLSIIDLIGFFLFLSLFFLTKNTFVLIFLSVGISFFIVRLGGLIHDAGHRAIFTSTLLNDVYGYFCSFFVAFPFIVWKFKHNAHHAHANEEGEDPDLDIPLSFTPDMAKRKGLAVRFMKKYQAWLFYPFGSLVSFTMRIKAYRFYLDRFDKKILFSMIFQGIGMFCWYILPFFIFPFWKAAIFFVFTSELSGFYMLNVFAPNHKGMPYLGRGVKFSFLEHQIMVSRNIFRHWLTDYVYMGLNYQIEHHLFPNCPRNKLHTITPFVLAICEKYDLNYAQMSILDSNRFILSELNEISQN